jgi:hypothetical protein
MYGSFCACGAERLGMRADIVELRRGDHSALRLMLEQERIASQTLDAEHKWKRKIVVGLEVLSKYK